VLQPDGKLVVAGSTRGTVTSLRAVRVLPQGGLDLSFGDDGGADVSLPNEGGALAAALQGDGKIILAGDTFTPVAALVRLTTEGGLDSTFGGSGVLTWQAGGAPTSATTAFVRADGRIVTGGCAGSALAVASYLATGAVDVSFGGGVVVTPLATGTCVSGAHGVLMADGRILLGAETTGGTSYLVRYLLDGGLDPTLGGSGIMVLPLLQVEAVALQSDGKILVGNYDSQVMRLLPDGGADPGFGDAGVARIPGFGVYVLAIGLTADGSIVAVGADISETNFAMGELLPDGTPNIQFGSGGAAYDVAGVIGDGLFTAMAFQPDGKLLVVGTVDVGAGAAMVVTRIIP
jgi:uncharacterized delta-60 repeat protein